jgi:hypothetical protein
LFEGIIPLADLKRRLLEGLPDPESISPYGDSAPEFEKIPTEGEEDEPDSFDSSGEQNKVIAVKNYQVRDWQGSPSPSTNSSRSTSSGDHFSQ